MAEELIVDAVICPKAGEVTLLSACEDCENHERIAHYGRTERRVACSFVPKEGRDHGRS